MALTFSVTVTDFATPAVGRASAFIQSDDAKALIGRVAVNAFGANFDRLNATPNAIGGPRTNYYSDARKSTSYEVSGDTVTIVVSQVGIALHYYGGTVTPKKGKYLTIPARPECHGKLASDFSDLIVLWGKRGPYGLGKRDKIGIGTAANKASVTVYFWLVSKATLTADPSTIPTEDQVSNDVNERLGSAITSEFNGGGES